MIQGCQAVVLCASILGLLSRTTARGNSIGNFSASHRLQELLLLHSEASAGLSRSLHNNIVESYSNNGIPTIVHQTWKDHAIPPLYQEWSSTWTKINEDWLHVIWSDEENRQLVQQHYPFLLDSYDSLPLNICRVDAIRALILHRYGGLYTDLDSEALRPLKGLMSGRQVVLGQMGNGEAKENSIPNAFMASPPDHRFWRHFFKIIGQYASRHGQKALKVEDVAGPMALKVAVDTYKTLEEGEHAAEVTILPPGTVFPIDWSVKSKGEVPNICDWGGHRAEFNATQCIRLHFPEAYSVQWWTHGWG